MMTEHLPVLRFELSPAWKPIDLSSENTARKDCDAVVHELLGAHLVKNSVVARRMQESVARIQSLTGKGISELYVTAGSHPAVFLLLSLTVAQRTQITLTPSVSRATNDLLSTLEQAIHRIEPGLTMVRRPSRTGETLRTHHIHSSVSPEMEGEVEGISISYWYPIPGTKELAVAIFDSPLSLIANHVLRLTDAFVAKSGFTTARRGTTEFDAA